MKSLLKHIRAFLPVNQLVRWMVLSLYRSFRSLYSFCCIHWPVTGTITVNLGNGQSFKIFSKGDDFVSTQAYWKGFTGYEGPGTKLFYELAKVSPVVIDIGANVGYFSLIAAGSNPQAHIHAFEPVEKIAARFRRNMEINAFNQVRLNIAAVGAEDGQLTFYLPEGEGMVHAGSSKKGWVKEAKKIEVPCFSLDSYKTRNKTGKIDLLKIDCEFHEPEALEGMKSILAEDKPLILMEVLFPEMPGVKDHIETDTHLRISQLMKMHGYSFYLITESGLIRTDELEYNPGERNYLFSTKVSRSRYLSFSDFPFLISQIR